MTCFSPLLRTSYSNWATFKYNIPYTGLLEAACTGHLIKKTQLIFVMLTAALQTKLACAEVHAMQSVRFTCIWLIYPFQWIDWWAVFQLASSNWYFGPIMGHTTQTQTQTHAQIKLDFHVQGGVYKLTNKYTFTWLIYI